MQPHDEKINYSAYNGVKWTLDKLQCMLFLQSSEKLREINAALQVASATKPTLSACGAGIPVNRSTQKRMKFDDTDEEHRR